MLAASGWPLQALDLRLEIAAVAGLAALAAVPTFVLRCLLLSGCVLDAASLLGLANAPWPLLELTLY